jgi:spore maturation protein CgeB
MEWIFTTAEECIPLYREEGLENIGVIPLAVEPKFLYPEKKEKIYDIVLIANHYPNQPDRVVDFNHIVKPLIEKDYPLKIWGHKDNWLKAGVPDKFLLGYDNRLREIYNQSKIVLGLNEQRFSPTMTSMRPYEVLGCKAFHLSAWSVAMENIFKDKEHLVLSRSPYETIELVDYYLTREEERDKIAESGYNHVINNHTYKHRVKKMLDYLGIGVK